MNYFHFLINIPQPDKQYLVCVSGDGATKQIADGVRDTINDAIKEGVSIVLVSAPPDCTVRIEEAKFVNR